MGYIGVITHLLTIDPNFKRGIQVVLQKIQSVNGFVVFFPNTEVRSEYSAEKEGRRLDNNEASTAAGELNVPCL